jgi:hypothetical protein
MNRFIGQSPIVTANKYNISEDYWDNNTQSKVFNTSTLRWSWKEFGDLSLYEAESDSLIP